MGCSGSKAQDYEAPTADATRNAKPRTSASPAASAPIQLPSVAMSLPNTPSSRYPMDVSFATSSSLPKSIPLDMSLTTPSPRIGEPADGSDGQLKKITEAYHRACNNGRGLTSAAELATALRLLKLSYNSSGLAALLAEADNDGDGELDLPEFIMLVHRPDLDSLLRRSVPAAPAVHVAVEHLMGYSHVLQAATNDGFIRTPEDLQGAFAALRAPIDSIEARVLFDHHAQSGCIGLDEFAPICAKRDLLPPGS